MAVPFKPRGTNNEGELLGIIPTVVMVKNLGEGWVENTTTTYQLPCPFSKARLVRASVYVGVVPIDADGATTYQLIKREAVGDSDDVVSAAEDAETLVAFEQREITLTGTVADRTFLNADILEVDLLNGSAAIGTDATETTFVLEFVLEE